MMLHAGFLNLAAVAVLATITGGTVPAVSTPPTECEADVLVIGGTPGGVAAARAGARVMLVEGDSELGGVLRSAWLATFDMSLSPNGDHLVAGIFLEAYSQLGISFAPDEASRVFGRMAVHEPGVRAITDSVMIEAARDGPRITSVRFLDRWWRCAFAVCATQVVDATDDGDVAAAAGVPYEVGRPSERGQGRWMQAATLIPRAGWVDWWEMASEIKRRRSAGADPIVWGVKGNAAWGYPEQMAAYRPSHPSVVAYPLNLARQNDGSVPINAVNITGVNGLDPASVDRGMRTAIVELPGFF